MDAAAIILSACLHKDIDKQALCIDVATKCMSSGTIESCVEEGRLSIKKSCFDGLAEAVNTPDNEILYYVSKCNDLMLDRLMNIKKKYYKDNNDKMGVEESIQREWLTVHCQKISRALTIYCKENTFGKVGYN